MTRGDGMIENAMGFSEASAFKAIVSSYQIAQNNQLFPQMKVFWKSDVPSKVLFFSWRLFHDRLATREQLQNRGVLNLQQSGLCSWCQQSAETINHLFFLCPIANQVFFGQRHVVVMGQYGEKHWYSDTFGLWMVFWGCLYIVTVQLVQVLLYIYI